MPECDDSRDDMLRRQFELTIRLLFDGEDPVGVYPLAAHVLNSARQVASEHKGVESHAAFFEHVLPGPASEFWRAFESSDAFTAHAEVIPEQPVGRIDDRVNDILLLLACSYYQYAELPTSPIVNLYLCWAFLAYHDLMKEDSPIYAFYCTMRDMIVLPDFPTFSHADQLLVGRKLMEDNVDAFAWSKSSKI